MGYTREEFEELKAVGANGVLRTKARHIPMGPRLPVIYCRKLKDQKLKLQWTVNKNDSRYEVLDSLLNLIPNRQYTNFAGKTRTLINEWELSIEEYRAIAGREGPEGYEKK